MQGTYTASFLLCLDLIPQRVSFEFKNLSASVCYVAADGQRRNQAYFILSQSFYFALREIFKAL